MKQNSIFMILVPRFYAAFLFAAGWAAEVQAQIVEIPYKFVAAAKYNSLGQLVSPACSQGGVPSGEGVLAVTPGVTSLLYIPLEKECELACNPNPWSPVVTFTTNTLSPCLVASIYCGTMFGPTAYVDCNGVDTIAAAVSVNQYSGSIKNDACGGALWADGKSEAKVWYEPPGPNTVGALPLPPPLTWSIPVNPSGAIIVGTMITSNSPHMVTVRAGMKGGTIRIRASSGNCFVEMDMDVVDPREGGGGGCPGSCQPTPYNRGGATPPIFGGGFHNLSSEGGMGLEWSLGRRAGGASAGNLFLSLAAPGELNMIPADLSLPWSSKNLEVIYQTPGGGSTFLKQIRVPDGLVDIASNDPGDPYYVIFYPNSGIGARSSNSYAVSGSALVSWKIEGSKNEGRTYLTITETRLGENERISRIYSDDMVKLAITNADLTALSFTTSQTATTRVEYLNTFAANGTPALAVHSTSKEFTASNGPERLTREVAGTGSDAHTNTYSYYTNGLLERVVRDDGSWEHYVYDAQLRPVQIFSAFGDQGPTTATNLCRLTEHSYDTNLVSAFHDAGVYHPSSPRRTVEYWLGQTVSVRFQAFTFETNWVVQSLSGALSGPGNLTNTTTLFTNGFFYREPRSVENPDGTMEFYEYTWGGKNPPFLSAQNTNWTNTVYVGVPNSGKTAIVDGNKTVTVKGPLGQLISTTTTDIASTNKVIAQQLFGALDVYSRPQAVTNLDGTWEYSARFCCGDTVTTNREGTVTTKIYDVLNRLLTTTANGVTHSNTYDAAGSVVKVERIGTNGNVIVQQRSGYDTAGHMTATTNALGEVTLFTEAHGLSGTTNLTTRLTNSSSGPQRIEARYLDGQTKSLTGGLAHPVRYEYGPTNGGTFTKEIKLAANGSDTGEWTIQFYDTAGRSYKTLYADGAFSQTFYNAKSQQTNSVDPDNVSRLTSYNALGQPAHTAVDSNLNAAIDLSGNDRVQRTTNYVANNGMADVHRSSSYQLIEGGSEVLVNTVEASVDGLRSWSITDAGTTSSRTFYPGSGVRIQMNWRVDGSCASNHFVNGRLTSSTQFDATGSQLGATTFAYDAHGRRIQSTDARNGATTNSFNDLDQVISTTTPGPFYLRTQVQHDSLGRPAITTHPDNRSLTNEYFPGGELKKSSGARTYPVEYSYDAQGRMKTTKTWQDAANNSGTAVTTWNYDNARGWLSSKDYADPVTGAAGTNGPDYAYTPAGRLSQRIWARGVTTSYAMNAFGEIGRITYSDGTGHVTNTYDRRGRVTGINQGSNVTARLYSEAGLLLSETQNGLVVSNRYDALLRRTNVAVVIGGTVVASTGYGYDSAGRLATVTDGTNSATYSYVANSPLIGQIVFTNGTSLRMTTSKQYDLLNRLLSITNLPTGDAAVSFNYALNAANQRTAITNADASRWLFGYDSLGQVTNGTKRWNDGSAVLGQQFGYLFDDIGNRKNAVSGGDADGQHLRLQTYSANSLNQYTSRSVPGYLDILGSATNTATVTVNTRPSSRKNDYYRVEVPVLNSSALWQPITNMAVLASGTNDYVTNWTGNAFVPATPELFGYDADGNMTNDGRWSLTWDAENRLVKVESLSTAPLASKRKVTWEFDGQGRRIRQTTYDGSSGSYVVTEDIKFVSDGWRHIAELNATNNALIRSYAWGLDLSGSMGGAGGVGGLLMMNSALSGPHFYAMDGNGNVAATASATNGKLTAIYEYDPFGRTLRDEGAAARENSFQFSTKRCDHVTGFNLYEFRTRHEQGWLSRDPIEEIGGHNLYAVAGNTLIEKIDSDGRFTLKFPSFPPVEIPFPNQPPFPRNPRPRIPRPNVTAPNCGKCGPDVTGAITALFQEVNDTFENWIPGRKAIACARLYAGPFAINAWDVSVLFNEGYPNSNQKRCENTFTFNGQCYWGGSLNYLLWGRMNALCGQTLGTAVGTATAYKIILQQSGLDITSQAAEMTACGYNGTCAGLSSLKCAPSDEKLNSKLDWKWLPYKE